MFQTRTQKKIGIDYTTMRHHTRGDVTHIDVLTIRREKEQNGLAVVVNRVYFFFFYYMISRGWRRTIEEKRKKKCLCNACGARLFWLHNIFYSVFVCNGRYKLTTT
jgi:hypothetical protein